MVFFGASLLNVLFYGVIIRTALGVAVGVLSMVVAWLVAPKNSNEI
jgi:hypothetical protein